MSWLVSGLMALLVLSIVAFVAPSMFGPAVSVAAPLLFGIAVIGLGAIWWRTARTRDDGEAP